MQYVDVAIARRLGERAAILTYTVPAALLPQIAPGVVVDVPFRARHTPGIVVGLRARLPQALIKSRLRDIHRVISPWTLLGAREIALRERIATELGYPPTTLLTHNLPPPSLYSKLPTPASESSGIGKFHYFITDPLVGIRTIIPRIINTLRQQKTALIIAATKTMSHDIAEQLRAHLPAETILADYHSDLKASDQLPAWQITLSGSGVIIGTRAALLLPIRQPGCICLFEPADRQFQEEQAPHWDALAVANYRRQVFGADILAIGSLPPFSLFARPLRRIVTLRNLAPEQPQIYIVKRAPFGSLAATTEELLTQTLASYRPTLVVVPQRGWAAGLVCGSCQTLIRCPHCEALLRMKTENKLTCLNCGQDHHLTRCPNCQGHDLRSFGWGSDRWQAALRKQFPNVVVLVPEELSRNLLRWPVVIAIEPERELLRSDYRSSEQFLRTLILLRQRATHTLLIETTLPNHIAFRELDRALPTAAIRTELALRRKHHYPPFGHLLTVTLPNDSSNLLPELQKIIPSQDLIGTSRKLILKLPLRDTPRLLSKIRAHLPRGSRWQLD